MKFFPHTQSYQFAPTDLSNYISCQQVSRLDLAFLKGELSKPEDGDIFLPMLQERGNRFEARYVSHLQKEGAQVVVIDDKEKNYRIRFQQTLEAMQQGAEYIIQGRLQVDEWAGFPDVLRKVEESSHFGDWSYEILDTKLAIETKAGSVLQLCVYTDLLQQIQGTEPRNMYIVKPGPLQKGFVEECFPYRDFSAFYRRLQIELTSTVTSGAVTDEIPLPVDHCHYCQWWSHCNGQRREADHLCFVAGMHKSHIAELERRSIRTLTHWAGSKVDWRPERGHVDTFKKLRRQASLQWRSKTKGNLHEFINFLPTTEDEMDLPPRGLARLPKPSPGDIYFDIEADRFLEGGGLEYLLGIAYFDEDKNLQYRAFWALDRKAEKKQFEAIMDWITARRKTYPDLHIYHYHHYETTALKRLMSRYDTRGRELDELLRNQVFIDLHAVVRESIMASVEKYSLKDLEDFYDFERQLSLEEARKALHTIQKIIEFGDTADLEEKIIKGVQDYNEDDCRSTYHLHLWVERLRKEWEEKNGELPRPDLVPQEEDEKKKGRDIKLERLAEGLRKLLLDEEEETWTQEHRAIKLLADLITYFRREEKTSAWEYFRLREMDADQLMRERDGIAKMKALPHVICDQDREFAYSYPEQEVSIDEKDNVKSSDGITLGEVTEINYQKRTIKIKKGKKHVDKNVSEVFHWQFFIRSSLEDAIFAIGKAVLEVQGFSSLNPCIADLLLKNKPRFQPSTPLYFLPGEDKIACAIRLVNHLDGSILPIQGPPGTGKSFTAAHMIVDLVGKGKKIGVTAVSHKVIENLLKLVLKIGVKQGAKLQVGHVGRSNECDHYFELKKGQEVGVLNNGMVVGATAFRWCATENRNALDYLFIDEAGQMSMAHVLASSPAAKNLILLGDPSQLEQPQQAAHPEGAEISALEYLLDSHPTMPPDRGLFLSESWRMHPSINAFVSPMFYEGKLGSKAGLKNQLLIGNTHFAEKSICYVPVQHEGNQSSSHEEADVVANIYRELTSGEVTWQDEELSVKPIAAKDILIITPYNAQRILISSLIDSEDIGTVDKFQGRQAPVVIFSMASSSADEAPRGMRFLYHPNRLNVAVSRAKCTFILVASPHIFNAECHTPDQMRWANYYCRFREMAEEVEIQTDLTGK